LFALFYDSKYERIIPCVPQNGKSPISDRRRDVVLVQKSANLFKANADFRRGSLRSRYAFWS
jgi:hypothetical protein